MCGALALMRRHSLACSIQWPAELGLSDGGSRRMCLRFSRSSRRPSLVGGFHMGYAIAVDALVFSEGVARPRPFRSEVRPRPTFRWGGADRQIQRVQTMLPRMSLNSTFLFGRPIGLSIIQLPGQCWIGMPVMEFATGEGLNPRASYRP